MVFNSNEMNEIEKYQSNIFTLPKEKTTLFLCILSIAIASLIHGREIFSFVGRYIFLALTLFVTIFLFGRLIKLAFNNKRILFLIFFLLLFIEIFDFIVYYFGYPSRIPLSPAVVAPFITIILYFSSEENETKVCEASLGILLLLYPISYLLGFASFDFIITFTYILIVVIGILIGCAYIKFFDKDIGFNVKRFLKSFILFWLTSNPKYLEKRLEEIKHVKHGWVRCLSIEDVNLIINSFHPGPFMYIGGATLTKKILEINNAIYLHSATTHANNLINQREVDKVVTSISCNGKAIKPLKPFEIENERFRAIVFPFDELRLVIISGKKAIDDIPPEIQHFAEQFGEIIIVDAHNAFKEKYGVTSEDMNAIKKIIEEIAKIKSKPSPMKYKFVKKRVLSENICGYVAILILEYEDIAYAILMIDSNNVENKFRVQIEDFLKKKGVKPVIVSTDTHLKTGLPPNLGYNPAGADESDVEAVFNFLNGNDFGGREKARSIKYSKKEVSAYVIGENFLNNIEYAITQLGRKALCLFAMIIFFQFSLAMGIGII